MSPFAKKYAPEYAEVLIRVAHGDVQTARFLSQQGHGVSGGRLENTCYIAQQAVEKALKAVICFAGRPVPLTHDLAGLLAAIPEGVERPPGEGSLPGLSEYASVRRYEEGFSPTTPEEAIGAVDAAEAVVAWGRKVISST